MADKQINQLVAASTMNDDDLLVMQQGGTAKKLSGKTLGDYVYAAAAGKVAEVNQAVADAQAAVSQLEADKDSIAQTVASMAQLGTDTALNTTGMAADAKAAGDAISDLKESINSFTEQIEAATITQSLDSTQQGVTVQSNSNQIIVYGTCTAARYFGFLNGQKFIRTSTSSAFTETLEAGTYYIESSASGYETTYSIRATYTTFADSVTLVSSTENNAIVTFNAPVQIAFFSVRDRNYGTSNNPTYITFNIYKKTANDIIARNNFASLTGYTCPAVLSDITDMTVQGITLTKLSDFSFKLSGTYDQAQKAKLFNCFNGTQLAGIASENVYLPNISDVGVYKLSYTAQGLHADNTLFAIFPSGGSWADRRYLFNGDTFSVDENNPIVFCVYGGSKYDYQDELIVNYWIEKIDYEVNKYSAVDVYGRYLINDIINSGSNIKLSDKTAILESALNNVSYAVDSDGKELYKNGGALNAYKKLMQAVNIIWENLLPIPDCKTNPDIAVGTHTGMIYSSVKEKEKYVFIDVSLTTFMTALHNPYSLIYTEDVDGAVNRSAYGFSYHGSNCGAYYGIVCSSFIEYGIGSPVRWETDEFKYLRDIGYFVKVEDTSANSTQLFDILWEDGHTRIVTRIIRNEYGMPQTIDVSESEGLAHTTTYTAAQYNSYLTRHECTLYRFAELYKNTEYTPSPFVAVLNEQSESYVYNDDICTFAGDYAAFSKGQIIHINYVKGDYTHMVIATDDTAVQTITLPESYNLTHSIDITSYNLEAGTYTAYLTDGTTTSEPTHFEIIDTTTSASGTIDNLEVTFNKNANPIYLRMASINGATHGTYKLTTDDINNGKVIINFAKLAHDSLGTVYTSDNYLRCIYQGEYGRVINEPILVNE